MAARRHRAPRRRLRRTQDPSPAHHPRPALRDHLARRAPTSEIHPPLDGRTHPRLDERLRPATAHDRQRRRRRGLLPPPRRRLRHHPSTDPPHPQNPPLAWPTHHPTPQMNLLPVALTLILPGGGG